MLSAHPAATGRGDCDNPRRVSWAPGTLDPGPYSAPVGDPAVLLVRDADVPAAAVAAAIERAGVFVVVAPGTATSKTLLHTIGLAEAGGHPELFLRCRSDAVAAAARLLTALGHSVARAGGSVRPGEPVAASLGAPAYVGRLLCAQEVHRAANGGVLTQAAKYYSRAVRGIELIAVDAAGGETGGPGEREPPPRRRAAPVAAAAVGPGRKKARPGLRVEFDASGRSSLQSPPPTDHGEAALG